MQPEEHTVTHTINRYRSFRYELILEGVVVGALAGAVVVAFRYLIGSADILLHMILDYGGSHAWFVPVWILILAVAACVVSLLLKWDEMCIRDRRGVACAENIHGQPDIKAAQALEGIV